MEHDGDRGSTGSGDASRQTALSAGSIEDCAAGRPALLGPERHARPDTGPAQTTRGILARRFRSEVTIETAILLTAQMFGLTRETVMEIVQVGVPEIARQAESNPTLMARLYAASRDPLPEPITQFYVRMATSPAVRQAIMDDFKATYGGMLDPVSRVAGGQAGTTDGQAREVLAALLPTISHILGAVNADGASGFAERLKDLEA